MSTTVYLGPYFRCRTRETQKKHEVWACSNPECSKSGNPATRPNFCWACGSAMGMATRTSPALAPQIGAVQVALYDALTPVDDDGYIDSGKLPKHHRWIPNRRREGHPREFSYDDPVEVQAGESDPVAEVEWLRSAYADELAVLQAQYGVEYVTATWGLLVWED
jgi:hypothetical protein